MWSPTLNCCDEQLCHGLFFYRSDQGGLQCIGVEQASQTTFPVIWRSGSNSNSSDTFLLTKPLVIHLAAGFDLRMSCSRHRPYQVLMR